MLVAASEDHGLRGLRERLAGELAEVECRFAAELLSDLACVNSLVTHTERYRGKMLRPMLVLLSGLAATPLAESSAGDPRRESGDGGAGDAVLGLTEAHRVVATVVEMVHMATLVHDDILDEAEVRRRGATLNHLRGNEAAVMLGDYLISHAYHLCSSLPDPMPSRAIADATNTVCEGELLQLANRDNWGLDEGTYLELIRRKTASLCGGCCRLGVLLHGGDDDPNPLAEALEAYGEKLGMAFQIVDDLLDLTGDQETVGKTLGRDLEKGKLTLPLIHGLRTPAGEELRRLVAAVHRGVEAEPDRAGVEAQAGAVERIRQLIVGSGSLEYARRLAAALVREAQASLAPLPDSPAKAMLGEMAEAILTRKF